MRKILFITGILVLMFSCQSVETKDNQVISFDYFAPHTISEGSIVLKASASSYLHVTFLSSDTSVATVRDSILTLVKPGEVTITAVQNGNFQYYQAAQVARLLTVVDDINEQKRSQTITFNLPDSVWKVSQGFLKLNATSTSGLPVTFTSSNLAYALITGNELEVASGAIIGNNDGVLVTISASQAGNYVYNAAQTVSHQIRVIHDVH
jgi:hypothetical protein